MKKIIFYLMILGLTFTGCNPLDDINNDIDAIPNPVVAAGVDYTFTAEDYETYETELNGEEYFINQDQADLLIPDFLADLYPVYGEGSLVNVGYNLFDATIPEAISPSENLSNLDDIDNYLGTNYEEAEPGTFVELSYVADVLEYTLTDDDFEDIEEELGGTYPDPTSSAANFGNFDRRDDSSAYWSDDMILEAFYAIFNRDYGLGQIAAISFPIYNGSSGTETFFVRYTTDGFVFYSVSTAIEYELSGDDYDDIVAALSSTYPAATGSMDNYGNFERRVGNSAYWSDAMILEALNVILPTATEGDTYNVTYDVYNGTSTTETLALIYASDAYEINDSAPAAGEIPETVELKEVIVKNGRDWEYPYIFADADYQLLGQSYGTFDAGAIYKLDIFLEDLYPYAQAGDVAMVQYEYYDGDEYTKYGSSIFDGNNWKLTPDIIETTFQYGFEDGEWVPDNTIAYTLLSADITIISEALIEKEGFEGPADNVGFFGSFDRRDGSGNYWSDDMLLEAFNILLDAKDSGAAEGQKYALTFVVYTGSTGNETKFVIKTGGEWVYQE